MDLEAKNYNLPGYLGGQRWTDYRLRAGDHNTLVLNHGQGVDQNPKVATRITRYESTPHDALTVADLTPTYAAHANRIEPGIRLVNRRNVLVIDEIADQEPCELW